LQTQIIRLRKKGQLTLPLAMREALGLADGMPLVAALDGDEIILTAYDPPKRPYDPTVVRDARALVARMVAERGGTYMPAGSISQIMDELRADDVAGHVEALDSPAKS